MGLFAVLCASRNLNHGILKMKIHSKFLTTTILRAFSESVLVELA